jgi:hypothetical protein
MTNASVNRNPSGDLEEGGRNISYVNVFPTPARREPRLVEMVRFCFLGELRNLNVVVNSLGVR